MVTLPAGGGNVTSGRWQLTFSEKGTEISEFETEISEFETEISEFETEISEIGMEISEIGMEISDFETEMRCGRIGGSKGESLPLLLGFGQRVPALCLEVELLAIAGDEAGT